MNTIRKTVGGDDNSRLNLIAGRDVNLICSVNIERVMSLLNTDEPSFADALEKILDDWRRNYPRLFFLERVPKENDHPGIKERYDYHKRYVDCVDTILDHLKNGRRGDAMNCIYRYMVDCMTRRIECKNRLHEDVTQIAVQYEENRLERETVWRAMDSMNSAHSHADEGTEFFMLVVYAICLAEGIMGPPQYEINGKSH